jgi:ribonuclease VapC
MNSVVLDASAILALLNKENGYLVVEECLSHSSAVMSAVNVAEALAILMGSGLTQSDATEIISEVVAEIVPFDFRQAAVTASLREVTKSYGLSLGDRACLSLGKMKKLLVLTADKNWAKFASEVQIRLVR